MARTTGSSLSRRWGGRWSATSNAGPIAATPARVDGPVCEGTDTFGDHDLPPLRRGDLSRSPMPAPTARRWRSTYNGRPAIPQVLLEPDGRLVLGRARGRLI